MRLNNGASAKCDTDLLLFIGLLQYNTKNYNDGETSRYGQRRTGAACATRLRALSRTFFPLDLYETIP